MLCYHPNVTWELVKYISSGPLTSISKGPENAVTRNFLKSVRAHVDFAIFYSHIFSIIRQLPVAFACL